VAGGGSQMKWHETIIDTTDGSMKAIAPEIISASRSTDIPAFYAEWFMNRFRQGYVKWINPFNQRPQYVSFKNTKVIVFWSKNPKPLIQYLDELDQCGVSYYFHFTLNDYEKETFEPGVPPIAERIETFKALSKKIGRERVIWRFDPLILTNEMNVERLLNKIEGVGKQIAPYTTKLVFSFADIIAYRKVHNNMNRYGIKYQEFTKDHMILAAKGISALCKGWKIAASTCAEPLDLSQFGIDHNKCIDEELILQITNRSEHVCNLFGIEVAVQGDLFTSPNNRTIKLKDIGQRAECGCVFSKDIGQYNTCPHLCVYCYANASENVVNKNRKLFSNKSETIISHPSKSKSDF